MHSKKLMALIGTFLRYCNKDYLTHEKTQISIDEFCDYIMENHAVFYQTGIFDKLLLLKFFVKSHNHNLLHQYINFLPECMIDKYITSQIKIYFFNNNNISRFFVKYLLMNDTFNNSSYDDFSNLLKQTICNTYKDVRFYKLYEKDTINVKMSDYDYKEFMNTLTMFRLYNVHNNDVDCK